MLRVFIRINIGGIFVVAKCFFCKLAQSYYTQNAISNSSADGR